jgi:tryptophan synthase beta chain
MYLLYDDDGQIRPAHSISAGLDYPGVGPEHSFFYEQGIAEYVAVTDDEALGALAELARLEGIIPALETAHALVAARRVSREVGREGVVVVNLSGRGDKDAPELARLEAERGA